MSEQVCKNCGEKPAITKEGLCVDCQVKSQTVPIEISKGKGFGKKGDLEVEVETREQPTQEDVETAREILEDLRAKCELLTGSDVWQHANIEQCKAYLTSEKAKKDRESYESEAYEPSGSAMNYSTGGSPNPESRVGFSDYESMVKTLRSMELFGTANEKEYARKVLNRFAEKLRTTDVQTINRALASMPKDKRKLKNILWNISEPDLMEKKSEE